MSATDVGQALRNLLAPLREIKKVADQEVEELQAKLDEARARKREVDKMLRAVDPEAEPFHKNGKGQPAPKYSPKRIEEIGVVLQENKERFNSMNGGVGFYASDPEVLAEFKLSSASLSSIFNQCRDLGLIRLSKKGGTGGRKYFKVV